MLRNQDIKKKKKTSFSTSKMNWIQRSSKLTENYKLAKLILEGTKTKISSTRLNQWGNHVHLRLFLQNTTHKYSKGKERVDFSFSGPQIGIKRRHWKQRFFALFSNRLNSEISRFYQQSNEIHVTVFPNIKTLLEL